jgi:hypothetical protein
VVAQAQGMQNSAMGMLDAMAPMLNNPAMTKNMTPQQKAGLKELQDIMADMKSQMASGHAVTDPAFAAKMQRIQALSMQMMAAGLQAPPAAAAPAAAPKPAQPHLKFSEDGK